MFDYKCKKKVKAPHSNRHNSFTDPVKVFQTKVLQSKG